MSPQKGDIHTFITYNLNEVKINEDMLQIIIEPKTQASIVWISDDGSSNLNTGHTHVTQVIIFAVHLNKCHFFLIICDMDKHKGKIHHF